MSQLNVRFILKLTDQQSYFRFNQTNPKKGASEIRQQKYLMWVKKEQHVITIVCDLLQKWI